MHLIQVFPAPLLVLFVNSQNGFALGRCAARSLRLSMKPSACRTVVNLLFRLESVRSCDQDGAASDRRLRAHNLPIKVAHSRHAGRNSVEISHQSGNTFISFLSPKWLVGACNIGCTANILLGRVQPQAIGSPSSTEPLYPHIHTLDSENYQSNHRVQCIMLYAQEHTSRGM